MFVFDVLDNLNDNPPKSKFLEHSSLLQTAATGVSVQNLFPIRHTHRLLS